MLRLRKCVLARLLSAASTTPTTPLASLHRLLSTTAPSVATNPAFAVEDYLVATCGLSRPQALKASTKLSHLKSPTNADAVIAFLRGHGLSSADVAALVAKDPKFLCSSVEKTLAPNVVGLTDLGLQRSEIARLILQGHIFFRCRSIVSNLQYYLPLFDSREKLLWALERRRSLSLLGFDLERKVMPNVAFLRECGIDDCDIGKLCFRAPRLFHTNLERVRDMVACAEGLGVRRGCNMFKHALHAVAYIGEGKIAAKMEDLKRALRWSDAEVAIAVRSLPLVLGKSKDMLQRVSEFLISEVGLEPAYIAHRPVLLSLSLDRRLKPRYYVLKFLTANGLLKPDWCFYTTINVSEKKFMEKLIHPNMEAAPLLAQDYFASCRGEMPARFRIA